MSLICKRTIFFLCLLAAFWGIWQGSAGRLFPKVIETSSGTALQDQEAREKKRVALTFDDGPSEGCTAKLLDGLRERGVKATFFVIGEEAKAHPDLIRRMAKEGHLLGNHTFHHVNLSQLTETAARKELEETNALLESYTGRPVSFYRPPFGAGKADLEKDLSMIQVLWSVDTMDWSCQDEGQICQTVFSQVKDGSIILMHDEYPQTVRAALSVIDCLKGQGYEFVTVDQLLMD